jgi:nucleotide-binding universal stress UspA family protein
MHVDWRHPHRIEDEAPPIRPDAPAPFRSILCGIDGTRSALEAARQSAILSGPETGLRLIAVTWRVGVGPTQRAELSPERAEEALAQAAALAAELGVSATIETEHAPDPRAVFLDRAADHDLLALGAPVMSRAGGILVEPPASVATHRAHVPVLLARTPPNGRCFPESILIATDATSAAEPPVQLALRIARRYDARAMLLHVAGRETAGERHRLAEEAAELYEALDVEPVTLVEPGRAHEHIVEVAERNNASLIVTGSRGLTGLHALASVSERVAHEAKCSVLIARPAVAEPGADPSPATDAAA